MENKTLLFLALHLQVTFVKYTVRVGTNGYLWVGQEGKELVKGWVCKIFTNKNIPFRCHPPL